MSTVALGPVFSDAELLMVRFFLRGRLCSR
jgi:hypothetical protein